MPKQVEVEYVFGDILVQENEPSTLDELIALIGEESCVDNINSNLRYRNKYPRVYRKASKEAEARGQARPQKQKDGVGVTKKVDGVETPVLVDPIAHLAAIIAQGDEQKKLVSEILTPIAQNEPIYVKGERTGGGGKISADAEENANKIIAADKAEIACEHIEATVPGYKVGRDPEGNATPESLARGLMALEKHLALEAKKKAKTGLASALGI